MLLLLLLLPHVLYFTFVRAFYMDECPRQPDAPRFLRACGGERALSTTLADIVIRPAEEASHELVCLLSPRQRLQDRLPMSSR